MTNKILLRLELQALSSPEESTLQYKPTNLTLADLIRHIRLYQGLPTKDEVETYYGLYKSYEDGILTYIEPFNKALANCKGCGTDFYQAYIAYCEHLTKQFKLINNL